MDNGAYGVCVKGGTCQREPWRRRVSRSHASASAVAVWNITFPDRPYSLVGQRELVRMAWGCCRGSPTARIACTVEVGKLLHTRFRINSENGLCSNFRRQEKSGY